jgi:hypothetical protein
MRYGRVLTAFMMVAALGFAAAGQVEAQEVHPEAHQQVEVTTEVLERFVEVYPEVMGIAQAAQVELATAESPEAAQRIQAQAQQEIAATLEAAEFSVAEYEAVVAVLNEDEELRAEFEAMLEARMGEGTDG